MLKTFMLVATLFNGNGGAESYVLDYDMSGEDCIAAMYEGASYAVDVIGQPLNLDGARLSCEFTQ